MRCSLLRVHGATALRSIEFQAPPGLPRSGPGARGLGVIGIVFVLAEGAAPQVLFFLTGAIGVFRGAACPMSMRGGLVGWPERSAGAVSATSTVWDAEGDAVALLDGPWLLCVEACAEFVLALLGVATGGEDMCRAAAWPTRHARSTPRRRLLALAGIHVFSREVSSHNATTLWLRR
eukprot:CAMPEP_0206229432 /NCGR_PEP_ID=MMETSP0047_2-20121206/9702_1 /ASSEMBLY_ACC=CAM_ASM_000192 /TAXON_ID=195065 /ORGANISM="Chroomonas mesostigmatica_cf, Strain CCMP1168" /LENGTH=176 /DNA_ID=CAMNT_0053652747 /DNA_START=348 /DNA_END=879 /DNA_ORIENTATION=-